MHRKGKTVARLIGVCLGWLVLVLPAHAGPWPRDPGQTFLALSGEGDRAGNSYLGLYGEYGLSRRRVLGAELGHTDVGETTLLLWYQKSLDDGEGPYRLSYSVGLGAIRRNGEIQPLSQAGLMLGRGLAGPWDGGWMTAEARLKVAGKTEKMTVRDGLTQVEYAYLTPEIVGKLDLTLGIRPRPDWAIVNQLRLERGKDSDFQAKLVSSVVYDIAGPARLEAGVIAPLSGPGEAGFKLGTWFEF